MSTKGKRLITSRLQVRDREDMGFTPTFGHIVPNILHADRPLWRTGELHTTNRSRPRVRKLQSNVRRWMLDLDSGSTKWEGASNR